MAKKKNKTGPYVALVNRQVCVYPLQFCRDCAADGTAAFIAEVRVQVDRMDGGSCLSSVEIHVACTRCTSQAEQMINGKGLGCKASVSANKD